MKALVTGASGFLGRRVVATLRARGHDVRALVRPSSAAADLPCEVFRADLRVSHPADLRPAFERVDVLVHLAATVAGDDEARFATTVVGTERLLAAMAGSEARRLVLAGSVASYDWGAIRGPLTERSPLAGDGTTAEARRKLYRRDGYAVAKVWQERVARRAAASHGWALTVVRAGTLWGRGRTDLSAMIGPAVGPFRVVFGPLRELPLTYVENCAEAFALAAEAGGAGVRTYNVTDGHGVSAWRYAGEHGRREGGVRVPVPYWAGLALARAATFASRLVFGPDGRLPSLLIPERFQARFGPLRFDDRHARDDLGYRPLLAFRAGLDHAFGDGPGRASACRPDARMS